MNMQRTSQQTGTPIRGRARRWMQGSVMLLIAAMLLQASPATAQQWDRNAVRQALQATVLVLVADNNGDLYDSGSGTVLDAERGIVLTNFHVMGDTDTGELYNDEGEAYIAVNPSDLRGAPTIKYVAKMIQGDPDLDLAVLRVSGLASGRNENLPKNLGLVSVDRGDSDELLPGDPLAVVGFPGLGGSTVTFTDGVVSGFLDENSDGVYEWIKTDTEVNPGNSGGLAIDQQGNFIGVPTAGYSRADVAGKISLIRPGFLALTFYDRAILGNGTGSSTGGKTGVTGVAIRPGRETSAPSGDVFGAITFASGVSDDDQPVDTGNAFVGIKEVYAFFSVTGLRDGGSWRTRWLLDGEQVLVEDQTWEGDDTPSTWVSLSHPDGLPAGEYTLELYAGSTLGQSGSFIVESDDGGRRTGAEAVNVTGVVHDADNARKTIAGALIVVLNPDVSVQEWMDADFDEAMVAASGTSVRGGKFQLDAKLVPGEAYSVVVVHDDYQALQVDGFEIPADASDPYELDVPLEKG
jgi:S1-C subfamily serine protease